MQLELMTQGGIVKRASWLVLAAGLAILGCGTSKTVTIHKGPSAAQKQQQAAISEYNDCNSKLGDLLGKEKDLNSRLDIGLNDGEYTSKLGDVRVAYDSVDFHSLTDPKCLASVGIPLESAMNQYVKASNLWSNCIGDINCNNDSIQPSLQRYWSKASTLVDRASAGLDAIKSG